MTDSIVKELNLYDVPYNLGGVEHRQLVLAEDSSDALCYVRKEFPSAVVNENDISFKGLVIPTTRGQSIHLGVLVNKR